MESLEIIGGGLSGLSLGIALRRRGVPVMVHEAGDYPRHRVCGEFIAGLDPATIETLGLAPLLSDALRHRRVTWHHRGRLLRSQELAFPAFGLSRFRLDQRLVECFVDAGGEVRTRARAPADTADEGTVLATGKRPERTDWIGLKLHVEGLDPASDLEVHLGDFAYIGLSRVEDGRTNVCGLFKKRSGLNAPRQDVLAAYAEASGLGPLAERVRRAVPVADSVSGTAGFAFPRARFHRRQIRIGDALGLLPPFTGDGMAAAFQSAAAAAEPLSAWASGRLSWAGARGAVHRRLQGVLRTRFAVARLAHPFFFEPTGQRWLARLSRARLLPVNLLFRLLH